MQTMGIYFAPTARHSPVAWGDALGFVKEKVISAESAIHFRHTFGSSSALSAAFAVEASAILIRAFSACFRKLIFPWGVAPGC